MNILSIYLPGFHKDEINDKAWGEGFTEWDNVRNGKKLYKEHYQPIEPLNNNYYDLSEKQSIIDQIKIAKHYKIDGFIFYHYWFENGVMALRKPAEILLKEIDEDFNFCFCWANHSWIKNWHGKNSEMIIKQSYGKKEEWKKHIDYLIEFFKDERYIKIDGRPILYIYDMADINCIEEMIEYWNCILKDYGLKEIYLVEYIFSRNKDVSYYKTDAVVEFEPLYSTFFDISIFSKIKRLICKKMKLIDFQNYDTLWEKNINRNRTYNGKHIQKGCFCAWDNSARKGHQCMIVKNCSANKFGMYLEELINNKRKDSNNDFIVINAWNEWSEGAILEPTQKDSYKFLEEIKKVKEKYEK